MGGCDKGRRARHDPGMAWAVVAIAMIMTLGGCTATDSDGRESPSTRPRTIASSFRMPNLVGERLPEAEARAEDLGLQVEVTGSGVGRVVGQLPPPGSRVQLGSLVTFKTD
jgi:hypothetical protein